MICVAAAQDVTNALRFHKSQYVNHSGDTRSIHLGDARSIHLGDARCIHLGDARSNYLGNQCSHLLEKQESYYIPFVLFRYFEPRFLRFQMFPRNPTTQRVKGN